MLRKLHKYWFIFAILIIPWSAVAWAAPDSYEPCSGAEGYKGISKVRPEPSSRVQKVRPYGGISAGFDALSRFNPCCSRQFFRAAKAIPHRAFQTGEHFTKNFIAYG